MFSKIFIFMVCMVTTAISAHPLVDFLREHHLDTPDGRTTFLENQLFPYAEEAELLNQKIQALALESSSLSPEQDQGKLLEIAQKVALEMGKLQTMLIILNQCSLLEGDFEQIEIILQNPDLVSSAQEEILQRIETIWQAVNALPSDTL